MPLNIVQIYICLKEHLNFLCRLCVVTTSSTVVLMVRLVTLLLDHVMTLQALRPGWRRCLLTLELQVKGQLRMWIVTLVTFVLNPTLAVRMSTETGLAVLCLRYSISQRKNT